MSITPTRHWTAKKSQRRFNDGQDGDSGGTALFGEGFEEGHGRMVRRPFTNIKPKTGSVAKRMWNMLSKYLNLKEWSVGGDISAGIPALAMGQVTLTLTFGP
ncbi:hypothetical protein ACWFR5_17905 [Streptomyces sp. NPDC055092]